MLERIDSGLDRLESVPLQRAVYQVLCSVIPESVTTDDQDFFYLGQTEKSLVRYGIRKS